MDTLANSEDPDEMPHNVAFVQSVHCLLRQKRSSEKYTFMKLNLLPLNIYNGPYQHNCIKLNGKFYWSKKGLTHNTPYQRTKS